MLPPPIYCTSSKTMSETTWEKWSTHCVIYHPKQLQLITSKRIPIFDPFHERVCKNLFGIIVFVVEILKKQNERNNIAYFVCTMELP